MDTFKLTEIHELVYNHNTDPDVLDQTVDQILEKYPKIINELIFLIATNKNVKTETLEKIVSFFPYLVSDVVRHKIPSMPEYFKEFQAVFYYVKANA